MKIEDISHVYIKNTYQSPSKHQGSNNKNEISSIRVSPKKRRGRKERSEEKRDKVRGWYQSYEYDQGHKKQSRSIHSISTIKSTPKFTYQHSRASPGLEVSKYPPSRDEIKSFNIDDEQGYNSIEVDDVAITPLTSRQSKYTGAFEPLQT